MIDGGLITKYTIGHGGIIGLEVAQWKKYCLVDKLAVSLILNPDLNQIIFSDRVPQR